MSRIWTEEQKRIVAEMFPDHFASEIAELVGKTVSGVYNQARMMGVRSSPEKKARAGRIGAGHPDSVASRFSKGHESHNKGKKVSPELYEKMRGTMFRKGHIPVNHRPVGSERVNVDGYVEVKVAEPGRWRLKHRVVWEKVNGKIPDGYNVQFRNGDTQDCRLENLYLISRADQMSRENGIYARYPEELREVIRLKGSIKRQITEYNKKHNNGKEC